MKKLRQFESSFVNNTTGPLGTLEIEIRKFILRAFKSFDSVELLGFTKGQI